MLDWYIRLLGVAARQPELPIGMLLKMTGAKPLRWKFYQAVNDLYTSSPFLKILWRQTKRWLLSTV